MTGSIHGARLDWAMEEGIRKDNPARQVRKAKKRETSVYRLTRAEVVAMLDACQTARERRIIVLGVCVGARNQELRGFRGEHFRRDDFCGSHPTSRRANANAGFQ
jgi:integrase